MADPAEEPAAAEVAPAEAEVQQPEAPVEVKPLEPPVAETTLAIIKPDAFGQKQHIIKMAQDNGFEVAHSSVMQLDKAQASKFYSEHYGKNFFDGLVTFMCSGECVVLALRKENAVADWRALIGPTSTVRAKESHPDSVRAKFGTDNTRNAVHGSASPAEALAELAFFFPKYFTQQRTVCYLLPHLEKKTVAEIEKRFEAWGLNKLASNTVTISDEGEATTMAKCMLRQQDVCTDPSEDDGSYLMPYAMRPHDPALDEPPPEPKGEGEEEAEEPAPEEPADAEEAAPAEEGREVSVETLAQSILSGNLKCYLLSGVGAVHKLNLLAGPVDPVAARSNPCTAGTLRAMYGVDRMDNVIWNCQTPCEVMRWVAKCEVCKTWNEKQHTLALIKPNAFKSARVIRRLIRLNGFTIEDEKALKMTDAQATEFYKEHEEKEFFGNLKEFMTSGSTVAMVLSRKGAIPAWRALIGPTDSETARAEQPCSLRALFGVDNTQNACHGSACVQDANREISILFPEFFKSQRTLAILKPDLQQSNKTSCAIHAILKAGFSVVDTKRIKLSPSEAMSFCNPDSNKPRAAETAAYMSSADSIALVLSRLNAVRCLKRLCGPEDPREAQVLHPDSLRARFCSEASTEVHNSLHASNSPAEANSEVGFFFPQMKASMCRTQGKPANPANLMANGLQATLTKGLTDLCKTKPHDPLRWFAQWLKNNNPNKPKVTNPPSPPKSLPEPQAKASSGKSARGRELVLVLDQSMTLVDPTQSPLDPVITNQLARQLITECGFAYIDIPQLLADEVSSQSQIGIEVDRLNKAGDQTNMFMLVIAALQKEIERTGTNKHVITGYPRDMDWVRAMEKYIGAPTSVLYFTPPDTNEAAAETNEVLPCITYFGKKNVLTSIVVKDGDTAKSLYRQHLRSQFFKSKPHHFIYLLGAAGAGRSSLGEAIANKYDFRHISVEQLMVDEILSKSKIGDTIDSCLKTKKPIDSAIVLSLLEQAIKKDTCRNFVIDGYPGCIDELAGIERMIGVPCDAAIHLQCSQATIEERNEENGNLEESCDPARMIEAARCTADQSFPSDQQTAVLQYLKEEGKLFEISAEQYEECVLMDVEAQVLSGCFKPRSKVFFVLGGPGSGKGTQCGKLVNHFGFTHLSAGDLLRAEVKSGSADGEMISEMIRNGKIVPAEVTVGLLKNAIESSHAQNFLVDGFPRDMANVAEWEKSMPSPELVLVFDCPESELEARLLKRGETSGREDDNLESIKKRFKTFVQQSMPVIKYYDDRRLVKRVSSVPAPNKVFKMTKKLFDSYPPVPELIFVLGGPGSGKGTQCARIVNDYGFVHISAGDLLREEIQKGSKDGEMIAGMIREGQIVPHDVTIRLLRAALFKHHDKTKYLIDGFPRNVEQVKHFCEVVGKARMTLFFDAPDEVLTERLMERGKDSGRTDDNAEAIAKRLRVYHKQSVPVIKHLQKMDTASVHSINANRSADEVYADVERVLLWDKQQIVWVTGQPLSGKTQLCSRLKTTHGAEHLSFADLLKAEALSNSQTGKKIASYVRRGERVPAELVVQVVRAAVDRCNGGLILLDGFPRKQAEADLLFEAVGQPKFVVDLDTSAAGEPDAVSIERIKQFDADSDGMLSKEEFATAGYIGTMLERAESEGDAAIPDMMAKLNAFTDETAPVIDTFKKLGKVRTIDATQDFEEVVSKAALML